jgi:hypothetical protein
MKAAPPRAPLVAIALLAFAPVVTTAPVLANTARSKSRVGPKVTPWWRISLPAEPGMERTSASLGRRKSADEGSRAAFRMLSRLIWWYPREVMFEVTFSYPLGNGGERTGEVVYVPRENLVMGSPNKWNTRFVSVSQPMIHRIARRKGKIEDLARYDTLALDQPLSAEWGKQPSMGAGMRASVQALARSTRRPLPVSCTLNWYIIRSDGSKVEVTVDYNRPRWI